MDAVVVKDVVKSYGDYRALDGISLTVKEGETLCIVGPNGAGKSTLLESLAGLVAPTAGSLSVMGRSVNGSDARLAGLVGFMPQAPSVHTMLTVEENLDLFARLNGTSDSVGTTIERLGLKGVRSKRADTLSFGYLQLLSLGVSLVHGPRVLLLDEPTASLYPSVRKRVWGVIHEECEEGAAVLYATHTPEEGTADRGIVLEDGKVTFKGVMKDVRAHVLGD